MIVDMWMTTDLITVSPDATISQAALVMAHRGVRRVLVVRDTADGLGLLGIVSMRDVARAFPPDVNPVAAPVTESTVPGTVATIMTRAPHTVTPDAPIEEAARVMREHRVGAVPVVRGSRPVGIITESDVFRAFIETCDPDGQSLRLTFELAEDEDLGPTLAELCRTHGVHLTSFLTFHHRDRHSGDRRRLGVVRLTGAHSDALRDAIWKSGHRVLTVSHTT